MTRTPTLLLACCMLLACEEDNRVVIPHDKQALLKAQKARQQVVQDKVNKSRLYVDVPALAELGTEAVKEILTRMEEGKYVGRFALINVSDISKNKGGVRTKLKRQYKRSVRKKK